MPVERITAGHRICSSGSVFNSELAARDACRLREAAVTKANKKAAETGGLSCLRMNRLLRGLLLRRIERAGLVDIGDLVIAEAEHAAQDLVGVLAEQGRALHVAR